MYLTLDWLRRIDAIGVNLAQVITESKADYCQLERWQQA